VHHDIQRATYTVSLSEGNSKVLTLVRAVANVRVTAPSRAGAIVTQRFAGKVAVVTGASSGIGEAIAIRLSQEGARMVLLAAPADAEPLESVRAALPGPALALAEDVSVEATAGTAVQLAVDSFGGVDLLASNAGVAYYGDAVDAPVEEFDHTMRVNVRGMFLMVREVARHLRAARRPGRIVCTASTSAVLGEEFQVSYNASKGAVAQLARGFAVDLAADGIAVNAVAPGWVATRATLDFMSDLAEWSRHRARIPLDRPAEPREIAAVVAFLLSEDASYMTGSLVLADGGVTAGLRHSDWRAELNPDPRPRARPATEHP
jgi:NAD(P)-dependent dehydrogenase (short-subunit alcohol dehydrogenase family)